MGTAGESAADRREDAPQGGPAPRKPPPVDLLGLIGSGASRVHLREPAAEGPAPIVKPLQQLHQTGRYRVVGELARGGMGVVLKGHDVELGRDVAMKVLRDEHVKRPEVVQRFVEEAQIGGQLQHPGIVPVYELGVDESQRPFFAMKLVKGRTLAALLLAKSEAAADRHRLLSVFEATCLTLAYAHSRGVIHRDLKPSNIMVGAFGEVQVVDWGLAKVLGQGGVADEKRVADSNRSVIATIRSTDTGSHSLAGSVLGTPAYMPPEQAQGFVDRLDERGDVFSLGAILCEIVTGQPPYVGPPEELLDKAAHADLADAHARLDRCGVDRELIELAKDCMRPAPAARPRSAEVVASRMTAHLASVADRAQRAALAAANARARARGLLLAVCALGLVVIAGGGGWWVQRRDADRRQSAQQSARSALDRVHELHAAASAAQVGETAPWQEALAAAKSAATLAATLEIDAETRNRAETLRAQVEREAAAVEAVARSERNDRAMVARLEDIRGTELDPGSTTREDFERAFGDYGIDVRARSVDEAAAAVRTSSIASVLATALDYWAMLDRELAPRLRAIAHSADPDPWRERLRGAKSSADVRALADSVDVDASPVESLVELVYALSLRGDEDPAMLEAAIRAGEKSVRAHPGDFSLRMALADALYRARPPQMEEGLRHATAAVALRPDSWNAWRLSGLLFVNCGRVAETVESFERAMALRPDDALSRMNCAFAFAGAGRWSEANEQCEKALALDATLAHARLVQGLALVNLGRPVEAAATLRRAIEGNPRPRDPLSASELVNARSDLALALQRAGELDEAMREAERAIALDPGRPSALAQDVRGALLARGGDLEGGRAAIEGAIRLDPEQSNAWNDLGDLRMLAWELDAAVAAYRESVRLEPNLALGHRNLGTALRQSGNRGAAVEELLAAIRLDPNDPLAFLQLGFAQRERGRLDESRDALLRCHELGAKTPGWSEPSARWVREAERLVALEPRLPAFLRGASAPADVNECLDLARLCGAKGLFAAAAGFYEKAFALDGRLCEDLSAGHRADAARCAALAAGGRGEDAATIDAAGHRRWLELGRAWLEGELVLRSEQIETGSAKECADAMAALRGWLGGPDFSGVREESEWRAFWDEVRRAIARASEK